MSACSTIEAEIAWDGSHYSMHGMHTLHFAIRYLLRKGVSMRLCGNKEPCKRPQQATLPLLLPVAAKKNRNPALKGTISSW